MHYTIENSKKARRNIIPFNGSNYSIWKFRIKTLIAEEGASPVLAESPPDELPANWQQMQLTAKSCIIEYLSDVMIGMITEEETAVNILKKLDTIYERKSLATQLAVQKKMLSFKFKQDTSLMEHFIKFDEMLIELTSAGATLSEMSKVAHLLLTLPPSCDGIVTAIETLSEDTINLTFVKTRLLDQETKLRQESEDSSSKVLHVEADTKETKFARPSYKNRKFHPSKGRNNNNKKQNNYKSRKYYNNNKGSAHPKKRFTFMKCDHCGRTNHLKSNCFYYKQQQQESRTLQTVPVQTNQNEPSFAFMVTSVAVHNDSTQQEDTIKFLLDSGATDHIINKQHYFTSFTKLNTPVEISVAKNNTSIKAHIRGRINITTNMGINGSLEDVLFTPDVPYNLLSVRRMQEAGMAILFSPNG